MRKRINIFTQNFDIVSFRTWDKARNPNAADDNLSGYGVADEWTNTASNEIFKCISNESGAARWISLTASALPFGTTAGQPLISTGTGWSAGVADNEVLFDTQQKSVNLKNWNLGLFSAKILNKAKTAWLDLIQRNESGEEVKADLVNIGTINGINLNAIGHPTEYPFSSTKQVTIEHNLGYIPSVIVVDESGMEVICSKFHQSANTVIISFTDYQSGKVIVK